MREDVGGEGYSAPTSVLGIILVTATLASGCAPADSGQMTAEREAALADTLRALTHQVDSAFKALEPGPYLALYSDDTHFYYDGSHLPRKKFEAVVQKEMQAFESFSSSMMEPQVEVLGPDAGVVSFRYEGTAVDTAGNSQKMTAAITAVFERRNGEWKVVQAHESFPPPQQ